LLKLAWVPAYAGMTLKGGNRARPHFRHPAEERDPRNYRRGRRQREAAPSPTHHVIPASGGAMLRMDGGNLGHLAQRHAWPI